MTWVTEVNRKTVTTAVLLWRHRGQPAAKAYAFAGWGAKAAVAVRRRAWAARRKSREQFGIETSYCQKNQAGGWTTSTDPAYRLPREGLAHLLRQAWVRLTDGPVRGPSVRRPVGLAGRPPEGAVPGEPRDPVR